MSGKRYQIIKPVELTMEYCQKGYDDFCTNADCGLSVLNGRYRAYDLCRDAFEKYFERELNDDKVMALHLYSFLSSWGMTTRNQYLMSKNFTCLENVVRRLKEHYNDWSHFSHGFCPVANNSEIREGYINVILDMKKVILNALQPSETGKDVTILDIPDMTNVLICKIIMVSYGCIAAFDSYIREEWHSLGYPRIDPNKDWLDRNLLIMIYDFVATNKDRFLELKKQANDDYHTDYSVFKIMDMVLWSYGKSIVEEKNKGRAAKRKEDREKGKQAIKKLEEIWKENNA